MCRLTQISLLNLAILLRVKLILDTSILIYSIILQEVAKNYTFMIFLFLMIGFTVFVYFLVPETKGKTIEEIASKFALSGDKIEVIYKYVYHTFNFIN